MKKITTLWVMFLLAGLSFSLVQAEEKPAKREKRPKEEFPFKRFYVDVAVGYGFPLGALHLEGASHRELAPAGIDIKDSHFSFGNGLNVGLNFGYKFNKYLAIDIGGSYMACLNTDKEVGEGRQWHDTSNWKMGHSVWQDMDLEAESGHVSIQLVASPGFKRVDPYAKAGMVFSIAHIGAHQTYRVYDDPGWSHAIFLQQAYGSRWAFKAGFLGALGMNIHLSQLVSLSIEWQFSMSNFIRFDWGDLKLKSEEGDREAAKQLLGGEPQRYTGTDHLSFNSHGLRIGVKFKF